MTRSTVLALLTLTLAGCPDRALALPAGMTPDWNKTLEQSNAQQKLAANVYGRVTLSQHSERSGDGKAPGSMTS